MKKLFCSVFLLSMSYLLVQAQQFKPDPNFKKGYGVILKAGTNGLGVDLAYQINDRFTTRLGFEMIGFSLNTTIKNSDKISLTGDVKFSTGNIGALVDYYLLPKLFVSGGVALSLFNAKYDARSAKPFQYGDVSISPEKMGAIAYSIKPGTSITPYLGIGFGRTLASKKISSFSCEIGCYYQGSPKIEIQATGMMTPSMDPEHVGSLEKQIKSYAFYPVVKLSFGVKLSEFFGKN